MRVAAACLIGLALAACDDDAVQPEAGADATTEAAVDAAEEPIVDAAPAASDASDASDADADADAGDGAAPCGIDQVWTTSLPDHLACTGLYTDFANKVTDPSALPYTPGLVLWADGADKSRWLYLPPNSTIDDSNMDEWVFPVGTKVWKEFRLGNKRIETRLYAKADATTWLWTTYQWDSGETDAVMNDNGATNVVGTYEIPDHGKCDTCHSGRGDRLMGVEAIALALPTASGVTLDWLAKNGKLKVAPTNTTATLPEDSTGKAALALGSLHIGCGVSCHNENQNSAANASGFWARLPAADVLAGTAVVSSLDTYTTTVNITPGTAPYSSYANQGYKRILPGNSAMSLLVVVTNERTQGQMPPIVTHVVDTTSVQELTDWIDAL